MAVHDDYIDFSNVTIDPYVKNSFAGMKIYSAALRTSPGDPAKLAIRCVEDVTGSGSCTTSSSGSSGTSSLLRKDKFPAYIQNDRTDAGSLEAEFYEGDNVSDHSYKITLGSVVLPEMYLLNYEKSTTVSNRVLTLEFVDKSILLDKIFVGLVNHHVSDNRPLPANAGIFFGGTQYLNVFGQQIGGTQLAMMGVNDPTIIDQRTGKNLTKVDPDEKPLHIDAKVSMPIWKKASLSWFLATGSRWQLFGWSEGVDSKDVYDEIQNKRLISATVSSDDADYKSWSAMIKANIKNNVKGLCVETDAAGTVTHNPMTDPKAGSSIVSRLISFTAKFNCEPCGAEIIGAAVAGRHPEMRQIDNVRLVRIIDTGRLVNVDHRYGGSIILGTEQFTTRNDDLPNVEYCFSDLMKAVNEAGIAVDAAGFGAVNRNQDYKKSYTGTLREVLNNWAADFAFQWDWDWTVPWSGGTSKSADSHVGENGIQELDENFGNFIVGSVSDGGTSEEAANSQANAAGGYEVSSGAGIACTWQGLPCLADPETGIRISTIDGGCWCDTAASFGADGFLTPALAGGDEQFEIDIFGDLGLKQLGSGDRILSILSDYPLAILVNVPGRGEILVGKKMSDPDFANPSVSGEADEIDLSSLGGALNDSEKKLFKGEASLTVSSKTWAAVEDWPFVQSTTESGTAILGNGIHVIGDGTHDSGSSTGTTTASSKKPVLVAFDLTEDASRSDSSIDSVKAQLAKLPDGMGVDSIQEMVSSEGTKKINFQSHYRKPAKARSYSRKVQYRKIYTALDPFELFSEFDAVDNGYVDITGRRSRRDFAMSCSLAKYSRNARTIFNWYYTPMISKGQTAALGVTILGEISGDEMEEIMDQDFSISSWERIFDRYGTAIWGDPVGYVAIHSKQEEMKWERFEQQIADMYGKYYLHAEEDDYDNQCGNLEKWEKVVQHQPNGMKVKQNNFMDLPFFNAALSHPNGRAIMNKVSGNFYEAGRNVQQAGDDTFMVFQRNAPWGTDQDAFKQAFVHSGIDFLENLVPTYINLQGKTRLRFYSRIEAALRDQDQALGLKRIIDAHNKDAKIVLILAPPKQFILEHFDINTYFEPPHFYDDVYETQYDSALTSEWWNPAHGGAPTAHVAVSIGGGVAGGWNNPNEYRVIDEDTYFVRPCKENYIEQDLVKDACDCEPTWGWVPTGSQMTKMINEIDDEQMVDFVCPRPGHDMGWGISPACGIYEVPHQDAAGDWYGGGFMSPGPLVANSELLNQTAISAGLGGNNSLIDMTSMPWDDWGHKYYDRMPEPINPNSVASVLAAFPVLPGLQPTYTVGAGAGYNSNAMAMGWHEVSGPIEISLPGGGTTSVPASLLTLAGWDGISTPGSPDYPTADEVRQTAEMYYKPFVKNLKNWELQNKFGTTSWPLIGKDRNFGSRWQLHLCEGFRINSYLPGNNFSTYANTNPANPALGTTFLAEQKRLFSPTGSGFAGPPCNIDIIFPSQNWYAGVRNDEVTFTKYNKATKEVRGCIKDAGKSSAIEVNSIDITNDFDSLVSPEGDQEVNMAVPVGLPAYGGYNFAQVNLDEYHDVISSNMDELDVKYPQRMLSFRQLGTKNVFAAFMSPLDGLATFNITLDQGGSYIDWAFESRLKELPKPEALGQRIGAVMNMNVLR